MCVAATGRADCPPEGGGCALPVKGPAPRLHLPAMTTAPAAPQHWPVTVAALPLAPQDDGYRYEIIDGNWHVTPQPRPEHGDWADYLHRLLAAEAPPYARLHHDIGLEITETRYLVPDLTVVDARKRAYGAATNLGDQVLLVVEIISPGTEVADKATKPALYAQAGIPCYWVVDLPQSVLRIHRLGPGRRYQQIASVTPAHRAELSEPWPLRLAWPAEDWFAV